MRALRLLSLLLLAPACVGDGFTYDNPFDPKNEGQVGSRFNLQVQAEFNRVVLDWDIPFVFGLAGSEEVGFLDALIDRPNLRYTTCIHENTAMAMKSRPETTETTARTLARDLSE